VWGERKISNDGSATLTSSIISGNIAAGNFGGGIVNNGTMTIGGSTISGNTISGNKAGTTSGQGGGIDHEAGSLTVTNSTSSGNTAAYGGAVRSGSPGTFTNVTVAANSTDIYGVGFTLRNTILANTGVNCITVSLTSLDYNLASDTTCTSLTGAHDLKGVNPLLGPLQDNGGGTTPHTFTHALGPTSPAIDKISGTGGCNGTGVTTDERSTARPRPTGGNCDIGAYEYIPVTPTLQPATIPSAGGPAIFTGTGFQIGTTMSIAGSSPLTPTSIAPDGSSMTVTVPAHTAGAVTAAVTKPGGLTGSAQATYAAAASLPGPQLPSQPGGAPSLRPPAQPSVAPSAPISPLPNPRP
jgi:hypothetical protein